ncbi:MAG: TetR/AcrR family transcriptional regulator [Deltaproteobacteria bacterium]|nr:TetR/AcrR family transcriptional regulator [Deltaproteobacteria bacterium]
MARSRTTGGKTVASATRRLEDARARMYHDLVFESAEKVFGERGFEHATMMDVAREAGVSLKTVYTSFAGKRELYEEIHEIRSQAFVTQIRQALKEAAGPVEQLGALAGAYASFLLAHEAWLRITLSERVAWGLGPTTGLGADAWRTSLGRIVEIIEAGMAQGVFHPGDAETLAASCLALMQVQIARAVERGLDREKIAAELETQLRRLLCR